MQGVFQMQRRGGDKRCAVCNSELPKYKCPRCARPTCSVNCVRDHKTSFRCSGQLRSIQLVSKSDYDEKTVLEDYALLEKAAMARNRARNFCKLRSDNRSKSLFLKRACSKRGIDLSLAPPLFQRNEVNKSYFNKRMDTVFWYIEFVFGSNFSRQEFCGTFPEGIKLSTALKKVICSANDTTAALKAQEALSRCATQVERLCCFFEVLRNRWTLDKRFYMLDLNESIMKNLQNKVVVEYPTVYVCLPENVHLYPQLTEEVMLSSLRTKNWERIPVERSVEELTSFMEREMRSALYSRACKRNEVTEKAEEDTLEEGELVEECPARLVQLKPSDWRPKLSSRKPVLSIQERRARKMDMVMRLAEEISKSQQIGLSEEKEENDQQRITSESGMRSQVRKGCSSVDYFGLTDEGQEYALSEEMDTENEINLDI